jgi:hypothetical protein
MKITDITKIDSIKNYLENKILKHEIDDNCFSIDVNQIRDKYFITLKNNRTGNKKNYIFTILEILRYRKIMLSIKN